MTKKTTFEEILNFKDMNNIIGLLALASAIWVIYDVWTKNKSLSDGMKILWTAAALLFSIVTAIVYYFTQKK